ncbi:MAG: hypothetical protein HGA47_00590, partial [Zoogloea sp.]|nr:hypothetical protein [Zoogloea sp.]
MSTPETPRQHLHPMVWVAAIAVTAFSLVGIGALTGVIHTGAKPAAETAAQPAAQVAENAEKPQPPASEPKAEAAPAPAPAPVRTEPRRTEHKAVQHES